MQNSNDLFDLRAAIGNKIKSLNDKVNATKSYPYYELTPTFAF